MSTSDEIAFAGVVFTALSAVVPILLFWMEGKRTDREANDLRQRLNDCERSKRETPSDLTMTPVGGGFEHSDRLIKPTREEVTKYSRTNTTDSIGEAHTHTRRSGRQGRLVRTGFGSIALFVFGLFLLQVSYTVWRQEASQSEERAVQATLHQQLGIRIVDVQWRYEPEHPQGPWAGPFLNIPVKLEIDNVPITDASKPAASFLGGFAAMAFPTEHNPDSLSIENGGVVSFQIEEFLPTTSAGSRRLANAKVTVVLKLHYTTQYVRVTYRDDLGRVVTDENVWGKK